ncbi:MAG: class I SAM-dependent methyltransferase [Erysipelotrichales bacterium]|nr:class I SAM-dependent methyltransferase [Erysipelotrichales bacterium]
MNFSIPEKIAEGYNKIADEYEKSRSNIGLYYSGKFNDLLPQKSCRSILDIGCGTGIPLTKSLVSPINDITGLDISFKMLDKAKVNVPNARFILGNILDARIERKFDGIFAWDSLFHIPLNNQEEVIIKVINWLNIGGIFLFTAGGENSELISKMFNEEFYYSSLSSKEYEKIIISNGCELVLNEIDDNSSRKHRVIICRKIR